MAPEETNLDRLLDVAESHARRVLILFAQDGLEPLFHLVCPGTHDLVVMTPFHGDASKDAAAQMIRELIREHRATAYMFVSEAWMIVRSSGYAGDVRPAEADDRIEVVLALATDGVDYRTRRWRIKRHEGKCIDLVLDSEDSEVRPTHNGRFDDLFTRH